MTQREGQLVFLGTGGSTGIPLIGCTCAVCTSSHPANRRLRPSIAVHMGGKTLVVDTGPDFREQALRASLTHVDGVLFTHTHYDHIAGIDELRAYNFLMQKAMPVLLSAASYEDIRQRYGYFFVPRNAQGNVAASFDFHLLERHAGETVFLGCPIRYVTFRHGTMQVTGFRFGSLAYISDIKDYGVEIFESLAGVETLVISAPKFEKSVLHLSIDEAIAFSKKLGSTKTWLTHISHEVDHEAATTCLPVGVALAYDGLSIDFKW